MIGATVLELRGICVDTPGGRPLFRDLNASFERGERAAVVGRNGVGKSTLLNVLAGLQAPDRGEVRCHGQCLLVPQRLDGAAAGEDPASLGEQRRRVLREAFASGADLLLLDEPSQGLDRAGLTWLQGALASFEGALWVVSHDRRLLRGFGDFLLVREAGCRHFSGSFEGFTSWLAREDEAQEQRYGRELAKLEEAERLKAERSRRGQRKAQLGRARAIDRRLPRALLNSQRGLAQQTEGKRAVRAEGKAVAARAWAKAARRALAVELPLALAVPELPVLAEQAPPIVQTHGLGVVLGARQLFAGLELAFKRERWVVRGPNGAGKSTLLRLLALEGLAAGEQQGRVQGQAARLGYIAQEASNWCQADSLLEILAPGGTEVGLEGAARVLRAHRFPLALAARPLETLSPGERVRAALIALFERDAKPELLILDEPADQLDLQGLWALEQLLAQWPGGLVLVSHDEEFVAAVGVERELLLGASA